MKTTTTLSGIMLAVAVLVTGCNKSDNMGPAQEAGKAVDDAGRTVANETREGVAAADAAAERTGDRVEAAADRTEARLDAAGERAEAAADRAGDRVQAAGAEVRQESREAAAEAKAATADATAAAGRSVERAGEKMQDASK